MHQVGWTAWKQSRGCSPGRGDQGSFTRRTLLGKQDAEGTLFILGVLPDICAGYASDVTTVGCDQVQSYWCVLVRGQMCSTFKEKFLKEWETQLFMWIPLCHFFPFLNILTVKDILGQEKNSVTRFEYGRNQHQLLWGKEQLCLMWTWSASALRIPEENLVLSLLHTTQLAT